MMEQFEKWFGSHWDSNYQGPMREDMKESWRAALEMVLTLCPNNNKATFANQGQGMDGFSELANYKQMNVVIKQELGESK